MARNLFHDKPDTPRRFSRCVMLRACMSHARGCVGCDTYKWYFVACSINPKKLEEDRLRVAAAAEVPVTPLIPKHGVTATMSKRFKFIFADISKDVTGEVRACCSACGSVCCSMYFCRQCCSVLQCATFLRRAQHTRPPITTRNSRRYA